MVNDSAGGDTQTYLDETGVMTCGHSYEMKINPQIVQISQIFLRSGPGTLRVAPSALIRLIRPGAHWARGLFSYQRYGNRCYKFVWWGALLLTPR
jgi:hypothetical protein